MKIPDEYEPVQRQAILNAVLAGMDIVLSNGASTRAAVLADREIPKPLQQDVWHTWRAVLRADDAEAFLAYQTACEAALASIR